MNQEARIQCLKRLQELCSGIDSILDFLQLEKLASPFQVTPLRGKSPSTAAASLYLLLMGLSADGSKIYFVDYEWSVLPNEFIKITIVTHNSTKEFSWSPT